MWIKHSSGSLAAGTSVTKVFHISSWLTQTNLSFEINNLGRFIGYGQTWMDSDTIFSQSSDSISDTDLKKTLTSESDTDMSKNLEYTD